MALFRWVSSDGAVILLLWQLTADGGAGARLENLAVGAILCKQTSGGDSHDDHDEELLHLVGTN